MTTRRRAKGYSVFWRKDRNRWAVEYIGDDGNYTQKAVDTSIGKRDRAAAVAWAEAWLAERTTQIEGGIAVRGRARVGAATIADLYPKWIEIRERLVHREDDLALAPSTVSNYRTHFKNHILPMLGTTPAADIDVLAARRWVRELRDRVKSVSMARNVHSSLAAFFDGVIGEGWVRMTANPLKAQAVRDELPSQQRTSLIEEIVRVPLESAQALMASPRVPPHRRARYAVAFNTGLADGEISGLMWSDLEFDAEVPTLTVRRACALVGKARPGAKSGHATLRRTKTIQRVRVVPLNACALAALREWREVWHPFVGRKPTPSDPVFPSPTGAFSRVKSAQHIRTDLRACSLPETHEGRPIEFHSTRRTFATTLELADVPEAIRQRLMGHARDSVTQRHYTGTELARLADAVAKIPLAWTSILPETPSGGRTSEVSSGGESASGEGGTRLRKPLLYPLSYGGEGEKLGAVLTARKKHRDAVERDRASTNGLRATNGERMVPSEQAGPTVEAFGSALDAALRLDAEELLEELAGHTMEQEARRA